MSNQNYLKIKIAQLKSEIKTKAGQVKELRARIASYESQLTEPEPEESAPTD